jgi:hypothetical protein
LNTHRTLHPILNFFPSALQPFQYDLLQFTSQSHLLANKRFRDRAASYIGAGGSQRLLRALPGAIIFGEPSPQGQGFASWAASAAPKTPPPCSTKKPKHALLSEAINIRRRHLLSQACFATFWISIRIDLDAVASVGQAMPPAPYTVTNSFKGYAPRDMRSQGFHC